MIFINNGDSPHESMSDEEFAQKYPDLAKAIDAPHPHAAQGKVLKDLRKDANRTVREMAEAVGMTPTQLCALERGDIEPTEEIHQAYKKALWIEEPEDELYQEAVRVVREAAPNYKNWVSIPTIQRRLRIGYNRAARLVEAMEQKGVVTAADEMGHRTVRPEAGPNPYRSLRSDDEIYPEAIEWAKGGGRAGDLGWIPMQQSFNVSYEQANRLFPRLVEDGHVVPPVAPGGCYQPAPGNGTLLNDRRLEQAYQAMLKEAETRKIACVQQDYFVECHRIYAQTKKTWQGTVHPLEFEEWRSIAAGRCIEPTLARQIWDAYHEPF